MKILVNLCYNYSGDIFYGSINYVERGIVEMNEDVLVEKILKLEYHQRLLLRMLDKSNQSFYRLVIEKSLREEDVDAFFKHCDQLSIELKEQKAEGFVYFHPLFNKFKVSLHPNLQAEDVIQACIAQQLFPSLMAELKKYV